MKKTTIFAVFFILIFSLFILTACGNKQATTNNNRTALRRPDFGQPERVADISGIVKAITGNEVTIIKIDRQNRNQDQESETDSESEGEQFRSSNFGATISGGSRGGGRFIAGGGSPPGGGGGPPGEEDEDSRAAMLERLKEMSSGEETVTIPVGIQMLKPDTTNGQDQADMVEATLSDVTVDKMINVWLDESVSDRKIAEFALIMR